LRGPSWRWVCSGLFGRRAGISVSRLCVGPPLAPLTGPGCGSGPLPGHGRGPAGIRSSELGRAVSLPPHSRRESSVPQKVFEICREANHALYHSRNSEPGVRPPPNAFVDPHLGGVAPGDDQPEVGAATRSQLCPTFPRRAVGAAFFARSSPCAAVRSAMARKPMRWHS
jgi:hypothetical protein